MRHERVGDKSIRLGRRQPKAVNIKLDVSGEIHDRTIADSAKPSSENRHTTARSGRMVAGGAIGRFQVKVRDIGYLRA